MAKKTKDIGFGYKSAENVRGIINKDGTTNILHLNRPLSIDDLYTYFIGLSWWKFFIMVVFGYTLINVFFG